MNTNSIPVSAEQLSSSARELDLPINLDVKLNDSAQIERVEILRFFRILPGKRVVCLARWHDHLVVAKIFLAPKRWQRHLAKESNGIPMLAGEGISTPQIEGLGVTACGEAGVLLLQYLDNSRSLKKSWKKSSEKDRVLLLRKAVKLIADCHSRGLIQHDIHLDNFLLQDDHIYLLDAADVEKRETQNPGDGLDSMRSLQNLALFFAQFPVSNDDYVPQMYDYYRDLRPELGFTSDLQLFKALLRKKRLKRIDIVLKKLFRSSSANICTRTWDSFVVYRRNLRSPAWQAFIDNPDKLMASGEKLKNGNSSTVVKIDIDGKPYVVKRYNLKSTAHFLRRMFRPSRAWVSWRNAHLLRMLGVSTPAPKLMMERRFGLLRRQAYFVSKFSKGDDVKHTLDSEPINSPLWQRALKQYDQLFAIMAEYGIVHGDTKATNFVLGPKRLKILDLDAMSLEPDSSRFRKAFEKDLQRFADNWVKDESKYKRVSEMLDRHR
ncbi:MAG: lipopolysaccharide kinase InaA family protein [Pseudohongiellaceae bacterium]|nr:lipopolysaccharide kinase InaA family protein [Pseudohongiellaceae bacterium]